jgi:Protein of unknown function (DUF2845)
VHRVAVLALLTLLAAASVLASDDTFRCGSKLIDTSSSRDEILQQCGAPTSRTSEDIPQQVRRPNGTTFVSGVVHVETWTYDRGSSKFPAVLRFEDGKLVKIEIVRP